MQQGTTLSSLFDKVINSAEVTWMQVVVSFHNSHTSIFCMDWTKTHNSFKCFWNYSLIVIIHVDFECNFLSHRIARNCKEDFSAST